MPLHEPAYIPSLAVIGGGAAGLYAACLAADLGLKVSVWEAGNTTGKKILATGNGRCNYSNLNMDPCFYHSDSGKDFLNVQRMIGEILSHHSEKDTIEYLRRLGVYPTSQDGYLYPASNQAATVRSALVRHLLSRGVSLHHNSRTALVRPLEQAGYEVILESGYAFLADAVIVACGGMAAPKTGSDGSGWTIARKLGHHVIPPVPALTYLTSSSELPADLHGVRIFGKLGIYEKDTCMAECKGEIQFTRNGISGIPAFQVSRSAARRLQEDPGAVMTCRIDLLIPREGDHKRVESTSLSEDAEWFISYMKLLKEENPSLGLQAALEAIFPDKLAGLIRNHIDPMNLLTMAEVTDELLVKMHVFARSFSFPITGTGSFETAQVSAGGISMCEVKKESLESLLHPGIFFAGEILDVDGPCGGYNLQWAWSSAAAAADGAFAYLKDAPAIDSQVIASYPRCPERKAAGDSSHPEDPDECRKSASRTLKESDHDGFSDRGFSSKKRTDDHDKRKSRQDIQSTGRRSDNDRQKKTGQTRDNHKNNNRYIKR